MNPLGLLRRARAAETHTLPIECGNAVEGPALRCPVEIVRRGNPNGVVPIIRLQLANSYQAIQVGQRQGLEQKPSSHAKNRSVRSDSESQGENSHQSKSGTLAQRSERVAKVLEERLDQG